MPRRSRVRRPNVSCNATEMNRATGRHHVLGLSASVLLSCAPVPGVNPEPAFPGLAMSPHAAATTRVAKDDYHDSMTPLPPGVERLEFFLANVDSKALSDALRRSAVHDLPCTEPITL